MIPRKDSGTLKPRVLSVKPHVKKTNKPGLPCLTPRRVSQPGERVRATPGRKFGPGMSIRATSLGVTSFEFPEERAAGAGAWGGFGRKWGEVFWRKWVAFWGDPEKNHKRW